jgi:predicted enzyme related to lactoylglutathione lyase
MAHVHHAIDYIELGAPDLAASKAFYAAAFGWTFNDYGPAYSGIQAPDGDGEVGGLDPDGPVGASGPLVLLYSDDLDATVAAVLTAGGAVTRDPYAFPAVDGSTSPTLRATSWAPGSLPPHRSTPDGERGVGLSTAATTVTKRSRLAGPDARTAPAATPLVIGRPPEGAY